MIFHRIPLTHVARHAALLVAWILLSWFSFRASLPYRRLALLVAGAVLIAATGAMIDLATFANPMLAAKLLRFYWFRLSDAMLPVGLVCAVGVGLQRWQRSSPTAAQWVAVVAICVAVACMAQHILERRSDLRPGADIQGDLGEVIPGLDAPSAYADWRDVCHWINSATPPGASFLTPPQQQTFKWYAGRSELVNRKDIPQDAAGICQWWRRYQQVLAAGKASASAVQRRERLLRLAAQYQCSYIVVAGLDAGQRGGLSPLYANRSFAVFRLQPVVP